MQSSLNLQALFDKIMAYLSTFSPKELEGAFYKKYGKHLSYTEKWWEDVRGQWLQLIKNNVDRYPNIPHFEELVEMVYKNSMDDGNITDIIRKGIDLCGNDSNGFISAVVRDLNYSLNAIEEMLIQTGIGIKYYYWQTAADDKVRGKPGSINESVLPSHWALDGCVCSWLDPSIVSFDYGRRFAKRSEIMTKSHPGFDWNCRCKAIPFDLDLINEIDNSAIIEDNHVYEEIREKESQKKYNEFLSKYRIFCFEFQNMEKVNSLLNEFSDSIIPVNKYWATIPHLLFVVGRCHYIIGNDSKARTYLESSLAFPVHLDTKNAKIARNILSKI